MYVGPLVSPQGPPPRAKNQGVDRPTAGFKKNFPEIGGVVDHENHQTSCFFWLRFPGNCGGPLVALAELVSPSGWFPLSAPPWPTPPISARFCGPLLFPPGVRQFPGTAKGWRNPWGPAGSPLLKQGRGNGKKIEIPPPTNTN